MSERDTPIYKRGKAWYVRIPKGGGQYSHRSLGKISQREAIEKAEALLNTKGGDVLFDDAAKRWLMEHVATVLPKSFRTYRERLVSAAPHLEGLRLDDVDAAALAKLEASHRDHGFSADTIALTFKTLASMFMWLEQSGTFCPPVNPVALYMRRARGRLTGGVARTRFLSVEEEARLMAAVARMAERDPSWEAYGRVMAFAIATGMRATELERAQRSWVHGNRIQIPASVAKSGKTRIIPLLPAAQDVLNAQPRAPEGDLLFWGISAGAVSPLTSLGNRVRAACIEADIPHASPHDLRRTCGCRLLQGSPMTNGRRLRIEAVSRWLGHASIAITQKHYAFITLDSLDEEVAEMFS